MDQHLLGEPTAGRLLIGFVSDRISGIADAAVFPGDALRRSAAFFTRFQHAEFSGVGACGVCLCAIFPSLIGLRPGGSVPCTAPNAIGFELSAAAMGGAVLPGLTGVLAQNVGLEVVGPVLVVSAIVIFGLHEAVVHMATSRQPGGTLV